MLSLAAGVIGVWFYMKESSFADKYDNELAAQLQWVGVGIALLGAAGFLIGLMLGYGDDD